MPIGPNHPNTIGCWTEFPQQAGLGNLQRSIGRCQCKGQGMKRVSIVPGSCLCDCDQDTTGGCLEEETGVFSGAWPGGA